VIPATSGAPTGTVSFYDNSNTAMLCTGTLNGTAGDDTASCTTTLTSGTTNALTAVYNGDSNFTGSSATSSAGTTVSVLPLDFTMVLTGSSIAEVVPGGSASYAITVTPNYGTYAGTLTFAVSGLPAGATATFSPSSIAANGGTQKVTVTIQTAAATASRQSPSLGRRAVPVALALLLLPLAGTVRMRRQGKQLSRLFGMLVLLAGISISTALTGCGTSTNSFTQIKSYEMTLTASGGGLEHSTTVILQVQ
jgi:Bacterial Ig-like domain (group 3)